MILVYTIVFLIVLALLFRRDLSALTRVSYRGGWKLAIIVAGLFVLQAAMVIYVSGQTVLQMILLIFSQVALVFLFILNRHIPGAKLFALGIVLNVVVMVANGGWMPVTPEIYRYVHPDRTIETHTKPPSSKNIVLPRSETNLWILSDIIPVALPWRRNAVSGGDLLLIGGAALFIFQTTSRKQRQSLAWSDS